jgi:hypothetical protein
MPELKASRRSAIAGRELAFAEISFAESLYGVHTPLLDFGTAVMKER